MTPPPVPTGVMPHGWEIVFAVITGIPMLIALAWAISALFRDQDRVPVVLMLAGAACCLLEPMVDVLGLCWYPPHQATEIFNLMGRPIPLFVLLGYPMTFGGYSLVCRAALGRGGPRALWGAWLGGIAFTSCFEFFAIHTHTYSYYGPQPLRVFGWPTWWGPTNALVAVTIAVTARTLAPRLRGWRLLALIPLAVMADAGVNAAVAWPTYTALWSHPSGAESQVTGLLTWVLAALGVWIMTSIAAVQPRDVLPAELPTASSRTQNSPEALEMFSPSTHQEHA